MNWDNLETYQDWADALEKLLNNAHDAIVKGDADSKHDAQMQLIEFYKNCASPIKSKELDAIASQAVKNIFEDTLEKAMSEIGSRTAELVALTKDISAVTDHANDSAAAMRLEKVRAVVDAASQALDTVKALKQQLDAKQPDKQKVADGITGLLDILQKVYSQVGDLKN